MHTLLTREELIFLLGPLFLDRFLLLFGQTLKHQRKERHARMSVFSHYRDRGVTIPLSGILTSGRSNRSTGFLLFFRG